MKQLLIILCLWLKPMCAMSAQEEDDLYVFLQNFTEIMEDFEHDSDRKKEDAAHSSEELLKRVSDSPPLYPDSAFDTLSAPPKPTYVINLRSEQPIPAAALPIVQAEQVPAKLFKRKAYNCKICHEHLTTLDNLHFHYAKEHPKVVTFNCQVCTEPYLIRDSLRVHLKRKHNLSRNNFLNQLSANK